MGNSTKLSLAIAGLILGTSLVACDDGRGGAEAAATAVRRSRFRTRCRPVSPLTARTPPPPTSSSRTFSRHWTRHKPTVEAGDLTLDGDTASVPLNYTWKIGARVEIHRSAELQEVRGQVADGLEPGNPGARTSPTARSSAKAPSRPQRADILGAGDAPLVTYRPVVNVGIDKPQLGTADPADVRHQARRTGGGGPRRLRPAGEGLRRGSLCPRHHPAGRRPHRHQRADRGHPRRPRHSRTRCRWRPAGPSPAPCSATVGEATAEQIEASEGALTAGDVTGIGGLQQQYDDQLRGTDAVVIRAQRADLTREQIQSAATDPRRVLFEVAPTAGHTAENHPGPRACRPSRRPRWPDVGPASAIVALRPSTGAVLAAASGPGSNGYNTAMLGQYAPGSIFKMVDSLAMFRNGLTPDSKVECTPTLDGGRPDLQERRRLPGRLPGLGDPPRCLRPFLQHGVHRCPGYRVTRPSLRPPRWPWAWPSKRRPWAPTPSSDPCPARLPAPNTPPP